jgi:hypothetical protein
MSTHLEAVFENGVFRPLEPVQLPEHLLVRLTIDAETVGTTAVQVHFVLPPDRWQALCDALDAPPRDIPELRKLLTRPPLTSPVPLED